MKSASAMVNAALVIARNRAPGSWRENGGRVIPADTSCVLRDASQGGRSSAWRSLRGWVFVIPCLWFGHGGIDATSPDWSDELSGWCVERAWQAAAGCAGGSA